MPFDYRPGLSALRQSQPLGPPRAMSPQAQQMRDWANSQQANGGQQAQMAGRLRDVVGSMQQAPSPSPGPVAGGPGMFQPGPSDGPQPGMGVGGQAMPPGPRPGPTPMPKPGMTKPIAMPKLPGGMSPFDKRGPRGI